MSECKYNTILMDMDGTLMDFDACESKALETVFARHGYPYSPEIRRLYNGINSRLWKEYEKGSTTKAIIKSTRFSELFQLIGVKGDGAAFNIEYLDELGKNWFPIEGCFELCRILSSHFRLYMATNGVSRTQRNRVKGCGLEPFFSGMFISEEIGVQKPLSGFFEYAASHIPGFKKEETLMVGDSLTSDMKGGIDFGLSTCWFNRKHAENPGFPITYEIHSLLELPPLLGISENSEK